MSPASSAPASIRANARLTVFAVPRQAPPRGVSPRQPAKSGAVSGRQRRQARRPDASAAAADYSGEAAAEYGSAASNLDAAASAAAYDTTATPGYDTTSYDTTGYDATSYDATGSDTSSSTTE